MLSKATHAGRICLQCRFQLRLTRPRPFPATTRLARFGLPRYTTRAGDEADAGKKPSEHKEGESVEPAGEDGSAPEPEAQPSKESAPAPEAKTGGSFADLISASKVESSGSSYKPAASPEFNPDEPAESPVESRAKIPVETAPLPSKKVPRWRSLHARVEVETTSLGMDILGKAGHTIVIHDREPRERATPEDTDEPTKDLDIKGAMEDHKRDTTLEETRRNIEELRPGDSRDLLARESKQILDTLMGGFTSSQLEDYICHFMGEIEGGTAERSEAWRRNLVRRLTGHMKAQLRYPVAPRYGWIRTQFAWTPPKDYPRGSTMKEKLALAIMRTCWHLQVMEETPYIGEMELHVSKRILHLLLAENRSLRAIQSALGERAELKVVTEKEKIQIFATRSKCDAVLDQLDKFVSRVQESTIPLSSLGPRRLTGEDLAQLSSLTGAHVAYASSESAAAKSQAKRGTLAKPSEKESDQLRVSWLETEDRPDTVESLQHVIFRLLLSATTTAYSKQTVKTVLDKENKIKPKDLVLVKMYGDNHEVPWNHRNQVWSRLVYPAQPKPRQTKRDEATAFENVATEGVTVGGAAPDGASAEGVAVEGAAVEGVAIEETSSAPPSTTTPEEQEAPEPTSQPDTTQDPDPTETQEQNNIIASRALHLPLVRQVDEPAIEGWSPLTTRTSAVFGHALHPFLWEGEYAAKTSKQPLHLKPVSPPVSALTSLAADAVASANTTLVIRFRAREGTAPLLELHLGVPEHDGPLTWEGTEKKLVAVRYSWAADVQLPLLPVDVSIQQSLASEMDPSTLESCSPLRTFIEASKLDLSADLLTPPSLPLSLPANFLDREGDAQEVDYLFTGLELRTSSTIPFRSHRLSYTSIEAGQQGRRAQLALHPPAFDHASKELSHAALKERERGYLDEVLRIAQGRYFSWMGSRPLDLTSTDDS